MEGTNQECFFQYGVRAGDESQIMCNLIGKLCSPEISGEECPERVDDGDTRVKATS